MKRTIGLIGVLGLMAATWSPESWLRRGNAAFERGDYRTALECYAQATANTLDPGQVAFDLAAAHYQLGEYRDAENCYRRSLEDADGARRTRALYGLGNSLAQLGQMSRGRTAITFWTDAVRRYEQCILECSAEGAIQEVDIRDVLANARYNLDVVKALLERQRAEAAKDNLPPNADNSDTRPDDLRGPDGARESAMQGSEPGSNRQKGSHGTPGSQSSIPPGGQPQPTDDSLAGKGNQPLLTDDAAGAPLSPDQALDYLQRNLDRIRRDRANRMAPPTANVKGMRDW